MVYYSSIAMEGLLRDSDKPFKRTNNAKKAIEEQHYSNSITTNHSGSLAYIYIYIYICISTHAYTYKCVYMCICICVYVCVYIYIYVCIYIYIYIYIKTPKVGAVLAQPEAAVCREFRDVVFEDVVFDDYLCYFIQCLHFS